VWRQNVIVADCDPAGGDLALRYRTPRGLPLDPELGLVSVAAAARRGLSPEEVLEHVQTAQGGLDILAGVTTPSQVTGIGPVWSALAGALRDVPGTDVLVDCGRITPGTPVLPLLMAADAVVLFARPTLEAYAHLRERLRWLAGQLRTGEVGGVPLGVAVVTEPGDTAATRDLDRLLQHSQLSVAVLGRVADDPKAADALAGRRSRRLDRSMLFRSARELAGAVYGLTRFGPTNMTIADQ